MITCTDIGKSVSSNVAHDDPLSLDIDHVRQKVPVLQQRTDVYELKKHVHSVINYFGNKNSCHVRCFGKYILFTQSTILDTPVLLHKANSYCCHNTMLRAVYIAVFTLLAKLDWVPVRYRRNAA